MLTQEEYKRYLLLYIKRSPGITLPELAVKLDKSVEDLETILGPEGLERL